jgi:hypothetical protein
LIERGDKKYRSSQRITAGADKWLDFETWGTTESCFAALRERGYRIAVTYCDGGSISTPIEDMDWSIPTAGDWHSERPRLLDKLVSQAWSEIGTLPDQRNASWSDILTSRVPGMRSM